MPETGGDKDLYQYDQYDQRLVDERVEQFREQTRRFLAGNLSDEEFRPLRLMNGLYLQLHAPMLRVAIPYGLLSSTQMRTLAYIAREYDRGFGHFSTRQNIQYNWPELKRVPDILADLAKVQMHAIQTSGNCIRNITTDHLAGIAKDEIADPRPYCELLRQWSTLHPEFSYLPRKFKIAVCGAERDRVALQVHDIGLQLIKTGQGETGFRVLVGGGQGRTPYIGVFIREFLEQRHLFSYLESILRVYNCLGRRDNRQKARIKILLNAVGVDRFTELVEQDWKYARQSCPELDPKELERVSAFFQPACYEKNSAGDTGDTDFQRRLEENAGFARWAQRNLSEHKVPGYRAVLISLKAPQSPPGDATAEQMDAIAELAERYSSNEIRVTHSQNLVLGHVHKSDLYALWEKLCECELATANIGLLTDMICCPGLDFCSLANAGSIPIAKQINERFDDLDYLHDLGELRINMSGCMNACGHHHVGHIGILGVDKKGKEYYQLTLGGSSDNNATLGKRLGPAVEKARVSETIGQLLEVYLRHREGDEIFIETYRRIGIEPFKNEVYAGN